MSALAEATSALAERGVPTSKLEDWRYVDLKREITAAATSALDVDAFINEQLGTLPGERIIVIDGQPQGDHVSPTADDRARWTARIADADHAELWALAAAAGELRIALRGTQTEPLHLIHVVSGGEAALRVVVDAAPGTVADLRIVHLHHASAQTSTLIDVHADAGANIRIDECDIGTSGQHVVTKHLRCAQDAHVRWTGATTGGALVRHALSAHLDGPNSEADLAFATRLRNDAQAHHLIRVFHHAGNARSRQVFKTVVDDRSQASFDGIITVDHGADETDALQSSNNLQLGPQAKIATRPQLDIWTDEVVASHGATVCQPDREEIAYLRSRGLDLATAHNLIVNGFINEALERIASNELRARADTLLNGPQ